MVKAAFINGNYVLAAQLIGQNNLKTVESKTWIEGRGAYIVYEASYSLLRVSAAQLNESA